MGDSTSILRLLRGSSLPGVKSALEGGLNTIPVSPFKLLAAPLGSTREELRASTEFVRSLEAILESSEFRSLPPRIGLGSRLSKEVKLKRVLAGRLQRLPDFVVTRRGELMMPISWIETMNDESRVERNRGVTYYESYCI